MRLYESVFIARQDISSQQVESMADEFAGIITNAGGKIHKREYWGLRSLAYRIKKNRKGHYIMFNLEKAHFILDEMVVDGCVVETNKVNILKPIALMEKASEEKLFAR